MRKLVLVVSAFLAACGGGGGSSSSTGLSGSVGGRAFTPVEVKAIPAGTGSTACTVTLGGQTASVGVKALALQITSYSNACADFASSTCQVHMGAQSVTILVAVLNPLGTEPAIPPGTYTLFETPTQPQSLPGGLGMVYVGFAQALATNSSCMGTPTVPSPNARGTIRLDSVGDPAKGHLSVSFQDGSKLEGDFSAPVCPGLAPDICQLASNGSICTGANCVP